MFLTYDFINSIHIALEEYFKIYKYNERILLYVFQFFLISDDAVFIVKKYFIRLVAGLSANVTKLGF